MPAPVLFVVSGVTQYVGAGFAVGLFDVAPATSVAWARIFVAALVLVAWARPWRVRWDRRRLLAAITFGTVLAAMNVTFYASLEHLPLGTAVAIEFIGPVLVAALTGRGARERTAIALALVGVVLLAGVTLTSKSPDAALGLVLILAAAACWAGYILLGRRVSAQGTGLAPLAVGMAAGAIVFAPFTAAAAAPLVTDWAFLGALVAIALASSVVPYAIDQVVLRRLTASQFAILLAIWPATAVGVGAVVLRQVPSGWEIVGLVFVSVAIALTSRPASTVEVARSADPT
nr:EamA family transporter [Sanguibacter gelidistatuariae]